MAPKSAALRLLAAVLLVAVSLGGLDVVDSDRTVVVLGGYAWFAAFATAALLLLVTVLRTGRTH